MSTEHNDTNDFTYKGQRSVLMACAVGFGTQPVLCNIIGSEPLFYIEEEYAMEDELFLSSGVDEDFFHLQENEPERLDRLRNACAHIERGRVFHADKSLESDLALLEGRDALTALTLTDVLEAATYSGHLTTALAFAETAGVKVLMSAHVETALYDRSGAQILVNPFQTMDQALIHMTRALRMVDHHKAGILIHPLMFDPEEAVLINRVMNADGTIHALRTAWDLKMAGRDNAWKQMISGAVYDLASAFAREAVADFRSLTDGRAMRAAFEQWFLSSRCKMADRTLIQTMLADNHGYVFDGQNFTKNLTKDVLARLGDSHNGQNYLVSILDQVLTDPLYNEIRDRSNANFLWFIKFERSFRDSEDELQSANQASQSLPDPADVIRMADHRPFGYREQQAHSASGHGDDDGATIYYLTHFVGLH